MAPAYSKGSVALPIAAGIGIALALGSPAGSSADPATTCPKPGDPAAPDGSATVVSAEPIVVDGEVTECAIVAEGELYAGPASGEANIASHAAYAQGICNVEVAGHEQAHIEMWDVHLHQRYGFEGHYVWIKFDGMGSGSGVKTVQWWTDVLWGGGATSWSGTAEGGPIGEGRTYASFESAGLYWSDVEAICTAWPDGSSTGYWSASYNAPLAFSNCIFGQLCWHVHGRIYGGTPPDW